MDDLFSALPKNDAEEIGSISDKLESDSQTNEISELSKKGYTYLKENRIHEAEAAFNEILALEENNNYALVGLGDSARKQTHFHEAIDFY